ncbi:hypothetical protein [Acinetobacter sp. 'aerobic (ED)']|uniref:hypothetical protein n=1 Tax=Acinetobacter sp. 'aerobic (ED)' TaxID=174230 RepID=UPI00192A8978|nr:hypothetical protein [Acinetobacter sp. 'aerobic (ED)']
MIKIFIQEFSLRDISFGSFLELFLSKNSIRSKEDEAILKIDYDDYKLNGTFFQKILLKEPTNNPYDDIGYVEFEYFIKQNFFFIKNNDKNFLVIINPNKFTKNFYNYLDSLTGLHLIFKDKKINLNKLIDENLKNFKHKIIKAKFNSVVLSESSKATIEIASSQNAINDFTNTFGNTYYEINKVKIILSDKKYTELDLDISKTGLIQTSKLNSINENEIINIINLLY